VSEDSDVSLDASEDSDIFKTMSRAEAAAEIDVFAALANPVRREILVRLPEGTLPVTELAERFEIGRPAVSEHLQVLRKARLVREEPRGRERYYHLDPRPLADVETWLDAFTKYWKKRMAAREAVRADKEKR
jgi:DNA-binding transcriptional ArsR family regulator